MDEYLGATLQNLEDKIDKLAKHAVNKEYKFVNYEAHLINLGSQQDYSIKRQDKSFVTESIQLVSNSQLEKQDNKTKLDKKTAKDSTRSKLTILSDIHILERDK